MFTKFFINKMDKKSSHLQKQNHNHNQTQNQNSTNVNATGPAATISTAGGASLAAAAVGQNTTNAGNQTTSCKSIASQEMTFVGKANTTTACGAGNGATTTTTTMTKTITVKNNTSAAMTTTTTTSTVTHRGRKAHAGDATWRSSNLANNSSTMNASGLSTRQHSTTVTSHAEVTQTHGGNISVLTQMQKQAPTEELADKLIRVTRRSAIKELTALHAKSVAARDKNEDAIRDLETRIPELGKIFDIGGRIGSGTFSTVLLATLKRERELPESERRKFAIKHHNPTNHPERIIRELECMFKIGGTQNIIGINCCIRYNDSIAFIMPYMAHDRFHDIFRSLTLNEIKDYMRNLLIALRHVHKFNVIHRDVKPSNILYNRCTRQFLLCDFGLAQRLAEDGSVTTQTNELLAATHTSTMINDTIKTNPAESPNTERLLKRITCAKDHDSIKRMRAMGGGGGVDSAVIISPPGGNAGDILNTSTQHMNVGNQATPMEIDERRGNAMNTLAAVTKKDIAAHKADTSRLINRLRQVSPNVDINNYVVSTNTNKKEMHASRAGTPGYRPPEVLLRYPHQTTSVDVWAAGVILLSIMSTMHPFFKAPNDCTALTEIMNLFGDLTIRKTAFMLDRLIMLTLKVTPLDLRRVCMRFRHNDAFTSTEQARRYRRMDDQMEMCRNCDQCHYNCLCKHPTHKIETYDHLDVFPPTAYDLLHRLLEVNPAKRITAEEALNHPFLTEHQTLQTNYTHVPVMPRNVKSSKDGTRHLRPYLTPNYPVPITDSQSINQLNTEMPPK